MTNKPYPAGSKYSPSQDSDQELSPIFLQKMEGMEAVHPRLLGAARRRIRGIPPNLDEELSKRLAEVVLQAKNRGSIPLQAKEFFYGYFGLERVNNE